MVGSNFSQFTYSVPYALLLWICIACVLIAIACWFVARVLFWLSLERRQVVLLQLIPPIASNKTPLATQQLFQALHALSRGRHWLHRSSVFSLELVSTRDQGIRYIARLPATDVATAKQQLATFLPGIRFKTVPDYMTTKVLRRKFMHCLEFRQRRHFAHPLTQNDTVEDYDQLAFVGGAMTKLTKGELLSLQLVLTPVNSRQARRLRNKLVSGSKPTVGRRGPGHTTKLLISILRLAMRILASLLNLLGELIGASKPQQYLNRLLLNDSVAPTSLAQAVIAGIHNKLSQPLFQANIRVLIVGRDHQAETVRARALQAALSTYETTGYQDLAVTRSLPYPGRRRLQTHRLKHRLPSLVWGNGMILAASEIATLYHFPYDDNTRVENVEQHLSRSLPLPAALKRRASNNQNDVTFGRNRHHGTSNLIGLSKAERERHVFILGGTGNGKTTLLAHAILQDIRSGKGVAVIDPHGDLAKQILETIPASRQNDVVYFNPDDLEHPTGLNLLELPSGLTPNELLREQDFVTEAIVSIFRKIFSEDASGGHRIEYILRNCVQTAFTIEGATLFTIYRLLTSTPYRIEMTSQLEDEDLRNFWSGEYGKAGSYQQVKMSAGVTTKIGRFRSSAAARLILEQSKSSIDFDELINSGKILICNLAKGLLGEDTAELLGITVLTKLQLAGYRRARSKELDRLPFYIYVDEFQNFATTSFVQLLSEARKYKLFLTMAEQSTTQQSDHRMVQTILSNVGTVICFRTGSQVDEQLLMPLFEPFVKAGEIANLPTYNFYMKLAAVSPQEPFSGETIPVKTSLSGDAT